MLIIFDLDDTLIDTSGCIAPFKMRLFLQELSRYGVPLREGAYQELSECAKRASSSREGVLSFAEQYPLSEEQIQRGIQVLTSPLPDSFCVARTPHAKEILEWLRPLHSMALVTGGHPSFQRDKLKKAGIDSSFFSMIGIPEDFKKKPHYQVLQEKFSLPPQEILVCGDRIEVDLRPAWELGFRTVHMRWGRGALAKTESWIDHSISDLGQLRGIIK